MHHHPRIESLEPRIAPATILTFTDGTDSDQVKLVSDKPLTAREALKNEPTLSGGACQRFLF